MSSALLDYLRRQYAPAESDSDLLRRYAAERDGEIFAALVRRHGPAVLGLCRRRLGESDAEDAFQAVFITLARKAGRLRRPEALAGWLHGVALRVCSNELIARSRRRRVENGATVRTSFDPPGELTARELLATMDEELQRLPERERLPLLLVYWQGRSQAEAALALGLTAGTLRGRLDRGRLRLAQRLQARGHAPGELRSLLIVPMGAAKVSCDVLTRTVALTASGATVPPTIAALAVVGTTYTLIPATALTMLVATVTLVVWSAGASSLPQPQIKPQSTPTAQLTEPPKDSDGNKLPPGAVTRLGSLRMKHPSSRHSQLHSRLMPSGKRALTWNHESLYVWDLELEKSLGGVRFDGQPEFRAMSRDGGLAAFETASELVIIDLNDVTVRKKLLSKGPRYQFKSPAAAFSPDGRRLAWYREDGLKLWDLESATEIGSFTGGLQFPHELTFTPDGSILVGTCVDVPEGRKAAIVRWDTATRSKLSECSVSASSPHPQLSRDGELVAVPEFSPGSILLLDAATGTKRHQLIIEAFEFHFINNDRWLVTIGHAANLKNYLATTWDVATGKQLREVQIGRNYGADRSVSQDGERILTATLGPEVFDLTSGQTTKYGSGHWDGVNRVQFTPDGRRLLSSGLASSICWNLADGTATGELSHAGSITVRSNNDAVLVEPQRAALVALPDPTRVLQSLEASYPRFRLDHTWYVKDVVMSLDGKRAVTFVESHPYPGVRGGVSYGLIHRWDLTSGKAEVPLAPPVGFSPFRFRSGGRDMLGTATTSPGTGTGIVSDALVEVGTGRRRMANNVPTDLYLRSQLLSPDGQTLGTLGFVRTGGDDNAATGYHIFTLLELRTNKEYLRQRHDDVKSMHFQFCLSANGLIAIPWGSRIDVRNCMGDIVTTIHNVENEVSTLTFRGDGRQLATGHNDGTVLLWDLPALETNEPAANAVESAQLWEQLKTDPPTAFRAMQSLGRHPAAAIKLLTKHMLPAGPDLAPRMKKLVADLDSGEFKTRQAASAELEKLAESARPALESLEKEPLEPEAARRLKEVLDRSDIVTDPEVLRTLRSVELLERIATPAATELLRKLAGGAVGYRLTRDAQDALARLVPRP